jgi:hypothetical protein
LEIEQNRVDAWKGALFTEQGSFHAEVTAQSYDAFAFSKYLEQARFLSGVFARLSTFFL